MTNNEQLDILYKLKKEVEKSKNSTLIHTINQVIKKVYLNQYTASFVGHFSAGKSTLINLLLEQDILPSSPVPTTSNTAIVSVADKQEIIANLENQQYTKLKTYDEVKKMNRLNVDVESVEINFPSSKFKNGFTLQDTPGVDSNVATHQSTTEQFMYTSNILFYTVDYNHVQSALNFQFIKRMNDVGIPVIFIINQIDKHNEDEITFETFKQRVNKSIEDWDIKLTDIFYVTKFDHPENELSRLSQYLVEKDNYREPIENYVNRTVKFITEAQLGYIQNELQYILEQLNINEDEFEQAYAKFQQNQAVSEEARLLNNPDQLLSFLKQKRKDILDNAYIMTHDMREDIRHYLESMSDDFKVGGLLNKKKKKQEEQEARLQNVVSKLQDKVNQQIRQPLREDMSFLTRFINSSEVNHDVLNQHYEIDSSLFSNLYQPQTSISNTYVLTFSDEVLKAITNFVEKQSNPLFNQAIDHTQAQGLTEETNDDLQIYEHYIELQNLKESLTTKNYQHYYIHMDDSLDKLIGRTEANYIVESNDQVLEKEEKASDENSNERNTKKVNIQEALNIIEPVPLFDRTKNDIKDTLERLENKLVKIGVFGTFSAGKSSLINALLGGQYLVSSPNPTTAATTELSYGEDSQITLKTEEQLLNELNQLIEYHNVSFESLEAFVQSDVQQLKNKLEKNQLAFVSAAHKHFSMYKDMLDEGVKHTISQEEIKKWSAEDEFATFVKTVHINLPLEWLKGKIIVDSLGLHSNNQRHTNETEQILTSSDLILYVSYFNHSFTDNDKNFIEHMKEMNQLNENQAFKMVINAVDLAENSDDLAAVKHYVKDALTQVNLKSDIFGVSSRQALRGNDEGINQLRHSIDQFVEVDSNIILEQQMVKQLEQINISFEEMIHDYKTNQSHIEQRQQQLKKYQNEQRLPNQLLFTTEQHTNNEVEDQIYHLNGRLKLQLLDDVKSIYNSQMTQNSDFNDEKKISSKAFLDQIHQRLYLEQSLLVERIKKYYNRQLSEQVAPTIQKLNQLHVFINTDFSIMPNFTEKAFLRVDLNDMINALPKHLTKRRILNPNTQRELQELISSNTLELLQNQISEFRQALIQYVASMNKEAEEKLAQIEDAIQDQIDELLSFNLDNTLIEQLRIANQKLNALLK
ncbi:MAG: dynamin family protein [Staphylococcus haemolyticus]|uniref:Dynamin family protein n=5 Tax=Staphylococcus haemolyticus TaxID=1283 RepID=A0A2A1K9W2_STAHA|nr:dynamin family protein [Staphylococcus haemolyticus]MBE7333210.1 dynamin family protein [Staphylococcus haemolyticus]MBE7354475.1 dynamin family protein [Staphylococcus haemolyticus]MBF2216870.1 dynamin family protein [Staphylococcus haemolyticus]MBF2219249.1 dynamin family protein [Staphylococcus haemolyticus]MBF2221686.1 dynamin family protein [Staphylococcus haemolyticus]